MRFTTQKAKTAPKFKASQSVDDFIEVALPFGGFYDSIHSNESEWPRDNLEYAAAFSRQWAHNAKRLDVKKSIDLHFMELITPSEFNFCTSRISVLIAKIDIKAIFSTLKKDINGRQFLTEIARDALTPTSGFFPNYSQNWLEWGNDVTEWDSPLIGLLMQAWVAFLDGEINPEFGIEYSICECLQSNGYTINPEIDFDAIIDNVAAEFPASVNLIFVDSYKNLNSCDELKSLINLDKKEFVEKKSRFFEKTNSFEWSTFCSENHEIEKACKKAGFDFDELTDEHLDTLREKLRDIDSSGNGRQNF